MQKVVPQGRLSFFTKSSRLVGDTVNQLAWSILIGSLLALSFMALAVDGLTGYLGSYLGPALYEANHDKIYPNYDVRITSSDGRTLGLSGQDESRREPIDKVPETFAALLVAFEDARFYDHHGVDRVRLLGALVRTIHGQLEGGSTITMQLAKMMKGDNARTLRRKLDDMALALAIEQRHSKEEILRLYADHAYFGHNVYGLKNACRYYFSRPGCSGLNLAEAAYLVGLVKAPSKFGHDPRLGKERRDIVLTVAVGVADPPQNVSPKSFLTWYFRGGWSEILEREVFHRDEVKNRYGGEALQKALATPLTIVAEPELCTSPYVRDTALALVRARLGEEQMRRGANVKLTIDYDAQNLAERALQSAFKAADKESKALHDLDGGAIVLDASDGRILALVGGRDYDVSQVPFALRPIQVGSAMKPFIYAEGFEQGVLRPGQKVVDTRVCIDHWCPKNYGNKYYGALPVEDALSHSLNSVAVRTAQRVGVEALLMRFRQLGFHSPLTANLTLALGTSEVTMLELATAYTSLLDGAMKPVKLIDVADDRHGQQLLAEAKNEAIQVYWPQTVANVRVGMARVLQPGGTGVRLGQALSEAWRDLPAPPQMACKTGTTNESLRVGMMCLMSDSDLGRPLVIAVFMGERTPKPLGEAATGGRLAGPAMREIVLGLARQPRHYRSFIEQAPSGPLSQTSSSSPVVHSEVAVTSTPVVYHASGPQWLLDLYRQQLSAEAWAEVQSAVDWQSETHEHFRELLRGEDWRHSSGFDRALSLAGKLARFVVVRGLSARVADRTWVVAEPHGYAIIETQPDRVVVRRVRARTDIESIRLFVSAGRVEGLDLITKAGQGESYVTSFGRLRRVQATKVVVDRGALLVAWHRAGLDEQRLGELRQLVAGTNVQLDFVRPGFTVEILFAGREVLAAHIKAPSVSGQITEYRLAKLEHGVFDNSGQWLSSRLWPIVADDVDLLYSRSAAKKRTLADAIFRVAAQSAVVLPTRARVVSTDPVRHRLLLSTGAGAEVELLGLTPTVEAGDVFASGQQVGVVDERGYLLIHAPAGLDQVHNVAPLPASLEARQRVSQFQRQLDFALASPKARPSAPSWTAGSDSVVRL